MRRFAVGVLRIFRRAFGGGSGVLFAAYCLRRFAAGLCGVSRWAFRGDFSGVYLAGVRAFLRRFVCVVLWRGLWGVFGGRFCDFSGDFFGVVIRGGFFWRRFF